MLGWGKIGWVGKLRSGLIRRRANFICCGHKLIETGAGHDHCIAPSVRVFGDPEKAPAGIFPELDDEALALDLQFSAGNDGVHVVPGEMKVTAEGKRAEAYARKVPMRPPGIMKF